MILKQFADSSDTTASQVVDIIGVTARIAAELHQRLGRFHKIDFVKNTLIQRNVDFQTLIEFVTTDHAEVIAFDVEEKSLEKLLRVGDARGIAGTHSAVNLLEGVVRGMSRIALETVDKVGISIGDVSELNVFDFCFDHGFDMGFVELEEFLNDSDPVGIENGFKGIISRDVILLEELTRRHGLEFVSGTDDVPVGVVTDCAKESCDEELAASALAVEVNIDQVIDIELDFHPGAAVRNDSVREERSSAGVTGLLEADARRSVQLADDNALRAVDNESTAFGHHRDFTDVDVFIYNGVFVFKSEINMKRGAVSISVFDAVNGILLRKAQGIRDELQDHLFVKTFDWEDFVENLLETLVFTLVFRDVELQERFIGVDLNTDEVRYFQHFLQFSEIHTFRH